MTPARKYFSHSQNASDNKLVLEPELTSELTSELKAAENRAKANECQRESRKRKKEGKKRGESSDDPELMAKKAKKVQQAQKITVYIHIWAPAPRTKSRAKAPESKEIIKGPCFFTVDQDYDAFKEVIAKSIPCKSKLLPVAQMQWRYEKPANDGRKPLSSLAGYEAMTTSLLERKKDYVVLIMIPPPSKDEEVVFSLYTQKATTLYTFLRTGIQEKGIMLQNHMTIMKRLPHHKF